VKALDPRELVEMGTQIILGNTYHLYIRPGLDIITQAGGLHKFINWTGPILTDSGGFQVFSLAKIRKIKAHGVEFRSHLDGALLFLGPKEAMEIQRTLGSDIAMVFDDCPPHTATAKEVRAAVERTLRWAKECREQPRTDGQMVFGIVQGGSHANLREECAKALVQMKFDGYAIGGVSVGEPEPEMMKAVEYTTPFSARRPTSLRHGARYARADGGVGRTWCGYVRLRTADARGAQWNSVHAQGHREHQGRVQQGRFPTD
jgi:queuine tRNA-ribosyltransferase